MSSEGGSRVATRRRENVVNAHAPSSQPGALLVLIDPEYPIRALLRRHQAAVVKAVEIVAAPMGAQRDSAIADRLRFTPEIAAESPRN